MMTEQPLRPAPPRLQGTLPDAIAQRGYADALLSAFALLLLLAPLPLGANRMWAASLVSVWVNLLLVLLLCGWMLRPSLVDNPFTPALRGAMLIMVAVLSWVVVQTLWIVPEAWRHPLWAEAGQLLQRQGLLKEGINGVIALDPSAVYYFVVRLLSYTAAFWLALLLTQESRRAHWLLGAIIITGLLYAAYGFYIEISGSNLVLWFEKRSYRDDMTSTFFNRNSYAAYAGLGLLCSCAYVFRRWHRLWRESSPHFMWRDFVANLIGKEIYWVLLPLLFFTALVMSSSRAGFASCMAGLCVLVFGLAVNKNLPISRLLLTLLGLAGVGAGVLLIGGQSLVERLNANMVNEDLDMRLGVYRLTWEAVQASPWFGYGLGNFDTAFRLFRDPTVIGWFQEAHNEYLEMMLDLGIPAAALWLLGMGLLVWRCLDGTARRRRDGIFPVLALAATTQEALHSVLDFSLQIPAVAITYAAILGMGVAQSRSSRAASEEA